MNKCSLLILGGLLLSVCLPASAIEAPGLSAPVTVYEDANGIPTIVGDNERDVAFVQGYLHARDRFFQMDYLRRVPSGTLAELLGPGALSSDIELRTLGLRRGAWASYVEMAPDELAWLKAYADGVNHWLNTNPLPPEYGALELTVADPWSPVDTLVIGKLLAFQLSFDLEINATIDLMTYQATGDAVGFDGTALFTRDIFRSQPSSKRISIPTFFDDTGIIQVPAGGGSTQSGSGGGSTAGGNQLHLGQVDPKAVEMARNVRDRVRDVPFLGVTMNRYDGRGASNWWVVSGEHTDSGYPILSNDPHLGLDAPAIFINENLVIRDENVAISGVSFPGTPMVVLGCNLNVCWGATTNSMDVTDAYQEELRLNNFGLPTHTVYRGEEEPLLYAFQSYYVNQVGDGTADNVERGNVAYDGGGITFIVPRRNHGPILDVSGSDGLSVQYAGWGATRELLTFRAFARADDLDEFQEALRNFDFGSQNWLYADTEGNIAYFTSGENPLRADLQNDLAPDGGIPPWFIRNGTGALNHEWLPVENPQPGQMLPYEILPWAEMPHVINPDQGYIANANNDPVGVTLDNNPLNQLRPGGNGLYYLAPSYGDLRLGQIDRKLQDLIAEPDPIAVDDMKALQANNQFLDAELIVPHLLAAFSNATGEDAWPGLAAQAGDPRVVEAIDRLAAWDFSSPTGIQEGFDPGDDPNDLPAPGQAEIDNSVAATIYSVWRGQAIRNTIRATLEGIGLGSNQPGSSASIRAFHHLLDSFPQQQGIGASGIPFFNVDGAPDMATARDTVLLASLAGALDLLASDEFAPAFGNSTDLEDYRWGRLHRVVFDHPLGSDPFNIPNGGGFSDLSPELPGIARPGGYEVIDASGHGTTADSVNGFMFGGGPARRTVAHMPPEGPDVDEIIPGGRSGVLVSPFYSNQLRRWLVNDYLPLNLGEADGQATAVSTTMFTPQ